MFEKLKKRLQKDSDTVYPIPIDQNVTKLPEDTITNQSNDNGVTHVLSTPKPRRERRKVVEIHLEMLQWLDKIPMTTHEVSVMAKLRLDTARLHLEYLEKLGKIERVSIPAVDKTLWRIRS